jgi:ribosomal protein L40E
MAQAKGIAREQTLGEVVSLTFDLYRRDYAKYLVLFLFVEAVIGVLTTLVQRAFALPALPVNPTPTQIVAWFPGFLGALALLIGLTLIVGAVLSPVALGSAVKIASEEIEGGRADLGSSVRFAISKLVGIWALSIIIGIIVVVGLIALIVPGIILGIMFSLALPAFLLGNTGVLDSLGRSRQLVDHRWLKTLAVFLVFGIIIGIAAAVASAISAPFGGYSNVVSNILSAFYLPLVPIALTVYYHSNVARTTLPQASQVPTAPAAAVQAGTKFCPKCGAQLASSATFCTTCGAPQPA